MKKWSYLALVCLLFFSSCNSVRRNEKMLLNGDYDAAIELSVKKIRNNNNTESVDQHKILLSQALERATEKDLRTIRRLGGRTDLQAIKTIYYTYVRMDYRQELIRPFIPLILKNNGQEVPLQLLPLEKRIAQAEQDYADVLALTARNFLNLNTKKDSRFAYDLLCELYDLRPFDKEISLLRDKARLSGTDFVLIRVINSSNQIIPGVLQRELMNFNTYGLDHFWTVYHDQRLPGQRYDYAIDLNFKQILFSPEQVFEREERRTKRLTGSANETNGLDNYNSRDEEKTVSGVIVITSQHKAVQLSGEVNYLNLVNGRRIRSQPVGNEFVFDNAFAVFTGDKRALNQEDLRLLDNRFMPFPTNVEMLLAAGEGLKEYLRKVLLGFRFQ